MQRKTAYALILLAILCAWGGSLFNGFALDDLLHIRDNYRLALPDSGWSVLANPAFPGNLYRPLTFYTYYLQVLSGGFDPLPFHLVNISLHLLVSLLVFEVFMPAISFEAALTAALLFATHPLNSESVANVSGRAELLAALFVLLSLRIAVSQTMPKFSQFVFLIITSFLAAASKESGVCVPLMVTLWLSVEARKTGECGRFLSPLAASCAGVAGYLMLRMQVMGGVLYSAAVVDSADNPLVLLSPSRRIVEALALLGQYLAKLFIPYPLSADYSYAVITFSETLSAESASIAALVLVLFSGSLLLRHSIMAALMLWFFLAFTLTANLFFPIGTVFAERLSFLPAIGIFGIVACLLIKIDSASMRRALVALLMVSGISASVLHVPVWKDTAALADYQEQVSTSSFRTQLLCAARDKNRGKYDAALAHIEQSIAILPGNEDAWYLKGAVEIEQKELQRAEAAFRRALEINPRHLPSLSHYARLALNQGQLEEAGRLAAALGALQPEAPESRLITLAIALKGGNLSTARRLAAELDQAEYVSDDFLKLKSYLEAQPAGN